MTWKAYITKTKKYKELVQSIAKIFFALGVYITQEILNVGIWWGKEMEERKAHAMHCTSSGSQLPCIPATEFCQSGSICQPHLAYRHKHFKDLIYQIQCREQ